jgi:hypothetical protein
LSQPSEKKESCMILAIEDFIKNFHSGDIVLSRKATSTTISIPTSTEKNIFGKIPKINQTVADMVAWSISTYQLQKDHELDPKKRTEHAYECLDFIERARAYRMVIPMKLTSKLKECQEQNKNLKELNDKLSIENVNQKKLIKEMHETIDRITRSGLNKASGGTLQ